MSVTIIKVTGNGSTSSQIKGQEIKETKETVGEVLVSQEVANVGLTVAFTKNLGDYNSAKIQVSLHLPCEPEPDVINAAFEQITEWCDTKLSKLVNELPDA